MLEKNIRDHEASIELLQERQRMTNNLFLYTYAAGGFMIAAFIVLTDISYRYAEYSAFAGILLLIVAGYFLILSNRYHLYLFMIHKKIVKAKDKHE